MLVGLQLEYVDKTVFGLVNAPDIYGAPNRSSKG